MDAKILTLFGLDEKIQFDNKKQVYQKLQT